MISRILRTSHAICITKSKRYCHAKTTLQIMTSKDNEKLVIL